MYLPSKNLILTQKGHVLPSNSTSTLTHINVYTSPACKYVFTLKRTLFQLKRDMYSLQTAL